MTDAPTNASTRLARLARVVTRATQADAALVAACCRGVWSVLATHGRLADALSADGTPLACLADLTEPGVPTTIANTLTDARLASDADAFGRCGVRAAALMDAPSLMTWAHLPERPSRVVVCLLAAEPRDMDAAALADAVCLAVDATPQVNASGAVGALDTLIGVIAQHMTDAIYVKDDAGRYVFVNAATAQLLRRSEEELLTLRDRDVLPRRAYEWTRGIELRVMQTLQPVTYERVYRIEGEEHVVLTTKYPYRPDGRTVRGVIGVSRDVTERTRLRRALRDGQRQLEQRVRQRTLALQTAANTDALTGLRNRRAFDEDLEALLQTHEATGAPPVSLLYLDLDNLKVTNDTEGHDRGDALLKAFAQALTLTFRPTDTLYRLGGDEFAVILACDGLNRQTILERVRQAVTRARRAGFPTLDASAGVASFPREARAANDLVRLADQRMLREKASRRATRELQHLQGRPTHDQLSPDASGLVWQAVRATLSLLARDGALGEAGWHALLAAAVAAVPGAEAGTFFVRRGDEFVVQAQIGFSDALLGLTQPRAACVAWHGSPEAWLEGRARVISGTEVAAFAQAVNAAGTLNDNRARFETDGDIGSIRANLVAPIVLSGEVVAHLNLDNLTTEAAFGPDAVSVAEEFVAQAAALLAADARRQNEFARRRELESLVAVNAALNTATTPEDVEVLLNRQVLNILGTEHSVFMRYVPERDVLVPVAPSGLYVRFDMNELERGRGLSWRCLIEREVLRSNDAARDPRVNWVGSQRIRSVVAAPLFDSQGRPIGALVAGREYRNPFTSLDGQLMQAIATAGATAIERAMTARDVAARADEFRLLAELSVVAGTLSDPVRVARRCLAHCRAFLHADAAEFVTRDHVVRDADGAVPDAFAAASRAARSLLAPRGRRVRHSRASVVAAPYAHHEGATPDLVAAGLHVLAEAPVRQAGRTVGYVRFAWFHAPPRVPPATIALTQRVAELTGQALELRTHVAKVEASREGAQLTLGLALELRDFETAGHTRRVVQLASSLGRALKLPKDDMEGLRQGAYLHDIGKLGIPDAILLKPGKLDPREWDVMRSHSALGHSLTAHIPSIHPAARIVVRHHHERWDGTGYPDGLAGANIPLVARVFAVCDVYDALTCERPYKRAWTHEEALREIQEQAGRQFDPAVVQGFTDLMRTLRDT